MLEAQAASPQQQPGLWKQAAGWRRLVIGASLLTAAAVALPLCLPQDAPPAPPHRAVAHPAPIKVAPAAPVVTAAPEQAVRPIDAKPVPHAPHVATAMTAPAQAASLPAQAVQPQQACTIVMPNVPSPMSGTVVGIIPHERSLNIFRNTARYSGGTVNSAYVDNVRVMVRPDPGTYGGSHNPVVPSGLHVAVGDHVTYQTPYRDPSQMCGFYPSQVVADQGPQAPAPDGADTAQ